MFACLLLLLLPAAHGSLTRKPASELAHLASKGDAVQLWESACQTAAATVVEALRQRIPTHHVELKGIDLDELRIWHGQSVSLGLAVDKQRYNFVVQSEPEWRRLADVLPAAQGGLLPHHDWDSLNRDWLAPVSHGSLLADFVLEGPVDVSLSQPTDLQLYLPHASDAGKVRRVLVRQGAAVVVRGARAVRLSRGIDLPPITLSEFADIVTTDAKQQQPLGVMHLLAGVQAAAAAHWNSSHPDQSLGLVALELEFAPRGATLLAASSGGGGKQRLRVRRVSESVIELLPRDGLAAAGASAGQQQGAQEGAVALPTSAAAGGEQQGVWPLRSAHPSHLQAYEKLLRQVVTSRLFQADSGKGRQPAFRIAKDVQLRLLQTEAEATTLLQMQLELERRPKATKQPAGVVGGSSGAPAAVGSTNGAGRAGSGGEQATTTTSSSQRGQPEGSKAAAAAAGLDEPPDPIKAVLEGRTGPYEVWTATVQIKGNAERGNLQFVPLHLQRVDSSKDSVQLAPGLLQRMLGNNTNLNLWEHQLA